MHRRTFLSAAAAAAAAAPAAGLASSDSSAAKNAPRENTQDKMSEALSGIDLPGVCDLHLHAAPDSKARSLSEFDMALAARDAHYRAVLYKSNDFSCHDRAFHLRRAVPGIELFGSIVLNRATGPVLNVYAVQKALETTGGLCRCVWMPTLDAQYAVQTYKQQTPYIAVSDGSGKLLPEVIKIMELCAHANVMLATGHSSPQESLLMARQARAMGFKKLVVTHPNTLIWKMTARELEEAARLGAWIEYCYLGRLWGEGSAMPQYPRQTLKEMGEFLSVAPERTFLTTDLGQAGMPHPVQGMALAIEDLKTLGISKDVITSMTARLAARLAGLESIEEA